MANYRTKQFEVSVHKYTGERKDDLPDWVQAFQSYAPEGGSMGVGRDAVGTLLIPTGTGLEKCLPGDYIVLDGAAMKAYKAAEFDRLFEEYTEQA
jgi:hypothetical protein